MTATDRHAVASFNVDALDYIVKPLTHRRFRAAIEKLGRQRSDPRSGRASERVPESSAPERGAGNAYGSRLWLRSRGQVLVLEIDEIEWIEADLRHSWVHLRNGERRRISESIGRLERRLDPARFARVHRSVIVSLDRVTELISTATTKAIILKSGARLRVSRSSTYRFFSSCESAP